MKKALLFFLFGASLISKAQYWQWANQSSGGLGRGTQTTDDGKGSVYAIIEGSGSLSTTYGSTTYTTETILAKHNSAGQIVWTYSLKSAPAFAISADTSGNVYVSGHAWGGAVLHGSVGNDTVKTKNGTFDAYLAKYDKYGKILWVRTAGDSISDDMFTTVKSDPLGNAYVSGFGSYYSGQQVARYYVSKYDPNGNLLWNITSPWYNDAEPSVADLDKEGNYYVTGDLYSTVVFGTTTITATAAWNSFIVKYDKNGKFVWAKKPETNADNSYGISVDNKGHFYLAGIFTSPSTFDGTTLYSLSSAYPGAMFIVKYDTSGTMLWAKSEGVIQGSIACDSTGFFIGGFFSSPPGNSSAPATGTLGVAPNQTFLNSTKNGDFFVAKYDNSGNLKWALQPGGGGGQYDNLSSVYSDRKGNCYLTGSFQGTSILGTTTLYSPYSSNYHDGFIIKIKDSLAPTATGIKNMPVLRKEFTVYPNPTGSSVNVQYATSEDCNSIDLYLNDVLGQRLYTKNCKGSRELNETIDLSHYPKGVYFVELLTPKAREVKKIVVE